MFSLNNNKSFTMFGSGRGSVVGAQAWNPQVLDSHFVRVMGRIYSACVSLFVRVA